MHTNVRHLIAGDFLPDLEFIHPTLPTTHSAAFAGHTVLLILCSNTQAWRIEESRIASVMAQHSQIVPVLVAIFSDRDDPLPVVNSPYQVSNHRARTLFFTEETGQYSRAMLVRRDGKIAWIGDVPVGPDDLLGAVVHRETRQSRSERVPPILVVERALPPELCTSLISQYTESAHKIQGRVGLSKPLHDKTRKRVSHINLSPELGRAVDWHLIYSLLPMLERCFDIRFGYRVAYKVALYDAADAGFFHTHRDNSDVGTRFRRYALSLALNDDWNGGGLTFPEYSDRQYRIGAGNALIFPVSLLHRVDPVQQGQRFVLLSFLYGEEGARDRRKQMSDPSILDGIYSDQIDPLLMNDYERIYAPESRFQPEYQGNIGDPDFIVQWRKNALL